MSRNSDRLSDEQKAWVTRTVDDAPPLTFEQRAKLAELLKPIRVERARRAAAALKAGDH